MGVKPHKPMISGMSHSESESQELLKELAAKKKKQQEENDAREQKNKPKADQ